MQITKEQIIDILCKESVFFEVSGDPVEALDAGDFDNVAEQILTLLQSNDAGQPNASKPDVIGSKCDFHGCFTFCGDDGITYCSNCGSTV